MKSLCLLLITLYAISVQSITTIQWSGNVTSEEIGNLDSFTARAGGIAIVDIGALGGFATYHSASLQVTGGDGSATVDADLNIGAVAWTELPIGSYAYYDGSANIDYNDFANTLNIDTEQSAGLLLSAFVRLEERNPAGDVVASYRLKDYQWDTENGATGSTNGLHYLTVKAVDTFLTPTPPADIYVSWVIADNYGLYSVDGVEQFIWPKNLESFFHVENYPYADTANNLVLIMAGCSGSVSRTSERIVSWTQESDIDVVSAGDDLRIVYNGAADYDGESRTLEVTTSFGVTVNNAMDGTSTTLTSQLSAAWGGQAECHTAEIPFSAGAPVIRYDPGLSQGELPSGAMSVIIASLMMIFAVLL